MDDLARISDLFEEQAVTLDILTTADKAQWREILDKAGPYDFCHLPEFHRLAEQNGEGEAVMPVFREDGCAVAFPMLLRQIGCAAIPDEYSRYRDAGCTYGFGGPVASTPDIPQPVKHRFQRNLQEFLESRDVVSVFCRLHPLIGASEVLEGYGNIVEIGSTASIDLSIAPEEQVRHYRRNHKQDIERLRRLGYSCRKVGPEYLDRFTRIYLDTMNRVNADSIYYFDRSYFERMMSDLSDVVRLFACEAPDGSAASVALCAACNGIIQVHLAGTAEQHRRLAPMKLVFDSIRIWGNEIGAATVHLGGGIGARKDSLFSFKMGFGSREHVYCTWQHIVNREIYERLCAHSAGLRQSEPDVKYFPEYRKPNRRTGLPNQQPADSDSKYSSEVTSNVIKD